MNERPAYASYLPSAYLAAPDGLLDRLIQMFEMLMAGQEDVPVRSLRSWVAIENLAPAVGAGLAAAVGRAHYDEPNSQLVFLGEMTTAERSTLEALVAGAGLTTAEQARHLGAIAQLYARSQGREESVPGLERLLDGIARYSDPLTVPGAARRPSEGETGYFDDDFVPYLARWVALSLRQRWPDAKRRRLIQTIVPLYKKRGTPDGIRQVLELFVEWPVKISEDLGLVIGERSTVAHDTTVGGLPHFFRVDIPFGHREPGAPPTPLDLQLLSSLAGFTRDVVDQEKPAHTAYAARIIVPGFIVGTYSTVEYDTLIGPSEPIVIYGLDSA
jgi:hypothetical protein